MAELTVAWPLPDCQPAMLQQRSRAQAAAKTSPPWSGEARSGNSALGLPKSAAGDRGAEAAVERKQLRDLLWRQQVVIPGNVRMRNGAGANQGSDATRSGRKLGVVQKS